MAVREPATVLAKECRIFTRYLIDREPAADVVEAYERAHRVSAVGATRASRARNEALMTLARIGPRCAWAADAYAALFERASVLRRKLVLLVAILESRHETVAVMDAAVPGSRAGWLLRTLAQTGLSVVIGSLAALVILPLGAWYRLAGAGQSGS
jgi:hypothetical protein